jgi:hypothetical protein
VVNLGVAYLLRCVSHRLLWCFVLTVVVFSICHMCNADKVGEKRNVGEQGAMMKLVPETLMFSFPF